MDPSSTEPRKFSYPNADRPLEPISGEQPAKPHPTVHLVDALKQEKTESDGFRTIRTFQSDVADAIKNDNISMIKIALAEKKRQNKEGTYADAEKTPNQSRMIFIVSGVVIALALLLALGWFLTNKLLSRSSPTGNLPSNQTAVSAGGIIDTEQYVLFDIERKDPESIQNYVLKEKQAELPLGSMEQIIFTSNASSTTQISTTDWLTAIGARTSGSLERALNPRFLFGIYSFTPHDSFVIFNVTSYDDAYAGMLDWESNMEEDLGGLIINVAKPDPLTTNTASSTVATSTSQFTGGGFIDRVINNKDTRVLLNSDGSIKLLYSFIDKNTLVIASSEDVFKEIIVRMTTGRIVR